MEKYRKQQKKKERLKHKDEKKATNQEVWKDKDPAPLIREIQKLQVMEIEGTLDAIMRSRKTNLVEKFNRIKKARAAAGMDPVDIPQLDYESLKRQVRKDVKARRKGEVTLSDEALKEYDDGRLPPLPLGIPPPHELIAYLILHERFPDEKFKVTEQTAEYTQPTVSEQAIMNPEISSILGPGKVIVPHPAVNQGLMTMMEVKNRALEIESRLNSEEHVQSRTKEVVTDEDPTPPSLGLVADYDEPEEDNVAEQEINPLENAPDYAVISAQPQIRNLQKELVHMIPASVMKRKRDGKK